MKRTIGVWEEEILKMLAAVFSGDGESIYDRFDKVLLMIKTSAEAQGIPREATIELYRNLKRQSYEAASASAENLRPAIVELRDQISKSTATEETTIEFIHILDETLRCHGRVCEVVAFSIIRIAKKLGRLDKNLRELLFDLIQSQ